MEWDEFVRLLINEYQAEGSVHEGWVKCPDCGFRFTEDYFYEHIANIFPFGYEQKGLCPNCNEVLVSEVW